MEAARSFETLVSYRITAWRHGPENHENLKSRTIMLDAARFLTIFNINDALGVCCIPVLK
jgi:hypothetical protein